MYKNLGRKKILVVDDEQAMLEIVKSVLKKVDALPYSAHNVGKAISLSQTVRFDAVVLDRNLNGEDGHDVLKALKANPATKVTPVVMLTGEKDMKEIKTSISLGAAGYIAKPFTPKDFLGQLDKILTTKIEVDFRSFKG